MLMRLFQDNAELLHLFSLEKDGFKYLTHDFSAGFDFVSYLYRCQQLLLAKKEELVISDRLFELVKGFILGPSWIDYKGNKHSFYLSSEEALSYFDSSGYHPLNNDQFENEIEDFRNSIRFRSGRLDLYIQKIVSLYPSLQCVISDNLKGADMYVETRAIRNAIQLILESMTGYNASSKVSIDYSEETISNDLWKSTIYLSQIGSFPNHSLQRDMLRLSQGEAGTFGSILKELQGVCEWNVISKWPDRPNPDNWHIIRNETTPELSSVDLAVGFSHVLCIYHKL